MAAGIVWYGMRSRAGTVQMTARAPRLSAEAQRAVAVAVSGHEQGQTQEAYAVEPAPHGRQWCGREGGIGGRGPVSPEDIARWCCGAAGGYLAR